MLRLFFWCGFITQLDSEVSCVGLCVVCVVPPAAAVLIKSLRSSLSPLAANEAGGGVPAGVNTEE